MVGKMSNDEIVAFKERFRADPELGHLACRLIAIDMAVARLDEPDPGDPEAQFLHRLFDDTFVESEAERAEFVEVVTDNWYRCLQEALILPAGEWPEFLAGPEVYLEPIQELEAAEKSGSGNG